MSQKTKNGQPLDDDRRARLKVLVDARGESAAAAALDVSRGTVNRALGGRPLINATRLLIEQRLVELGAS